MAWTYATLTSAIEDYLQNQETTFVSYIPTIIRQAEDRINKAVILPVNRKDGAVTLVSGTATATSPTDFLAPFAISIISSGVYSPCEYTDVSFIREAYPTPATTGTPKWYSVYNSTQLIFGPTPGSGLTTLLSYFFKPASIVDTSPSWLGTNAENCLLYGCLSEAYTFLKGDADLMKKYEDAFVLAVGDLKKLGEGLDMGDAYRMQERRLPR